MDTAALAIGRFAADLRFEDLPQPAVERIKGIVLDSIGCALGAYASEPCSIAREVVLQSGGTPESSIIGGSTLTSCANATLVNGTQIRYLDFNDTYFSPHRLSIHPSNCIAEALAVGERQHSSGRDIILAVALGYEIQCRFADAFRLPGFFHSTIGGFAAPVVAGKLLGLDAERMANAIGLGGSHNIASNGIYGEGFVSMIKSLAYAFASQSGVSAALLAEKGFTGPTTIIETFNRLFEGDISLDALVAPPDDWGVMKSWLKPFMAVHPSHSAVTALLDISKEHSLTAEQVEGIHARSFNNGRGPVPRRRPAPSNKEEADHNQAYVLAMALLDGEVGPAQYEREQWNDPHVQDLIGRIEFEGDAEFDSLFPALWPAVVTVTTRDGRSFSKRIDLPKGGPQNPMSNAEIESKFRGLAAGAIPDEQIDAVIEATRGLDALEDVAALMVLLRP